MPQLITDRMAEQVQSWRQASDDRAVFLDCYRLMTTNVLSATDANEFHDAVWVSKLLHRFADYYFIALEAYEVTPATAPLVWQYAHQWAGDRRMSALQKLLIGVNAHINYDLALTLADVLPPDWAGQNEDQRSQRYHDHCHVNRVIARTIDAVQDDILEPAMPIMQFVDDWMGSVDEYLIAQLITRWRSNVWRNAQRLLEANDSSARRRVIQQIEADALRMGHAIAVK